MDDTPTPTAQDWESLGMERAAEFPGGWEAWHQDAPYLTVDPWRGEWDVDLDPTASLGVCESVGRYATEAEAWTICAALVLLATGVLSAGAQQP